MILPYILGGTAFLILFIAHEYAAWVQHKQNAQILGDLAAIKHQLKKTKTAK